MIAVNAFTATDSWIVTPADSARAVADVYSVSLLLLLPLALAIAAAVLLRNSPAGTRALVWRATFATLLLLFAGRMFPIQWMDWALPAALARPLVLLGKAQMTFAGQLPAGDVHASTGTAAGNSLTQIIFFAYWLGVALVLLHSIAGLLRNAWTARQARAVDEQEWLEALWSAQQLLGVRRRVRLFTSDAASVPFTWGILRPAIMIPHVALSWPAVRRDAILLHEVAHIRSHDWAFGFAARVVCAVFWFNPVVWWMSRQLHSECELASDDRVLESGIRASDYAELLADAAQRSPRVLSHATALAVAEPSGLRTRLAAILQTGRNHRAPARPRVMFAALCAFATAVPLCAVDLVPNRDVLTTLMEDARWESRAYAVLGLAQRPDSLFIAATAAHSDPSPQVRAWARYALSLRGLNLQPLDAPPRTG